MRLVKSTARLLLKRQKYLLFTRISFLSTFEVKKNAENPTERTYEVNRIRNIGIMAHIDAGKTTTTERILYLSGFSRHLGDVDRGDTVTDFLEQERERGITIQSAAVTYFWNNHKINLIDTPGHIDFTVEVERSLRVLDGAVAVLDASAGVEAQTISVWRQSDKFEVPRIIFLNKMDKLGANFNMCLNSIRKKLNVEPIPINLPVGKESSFSGIVDLINLERMTWDSNHSKDGSVFKKDKINLDANDDMVQTVLKAQETMIGNLADFDETIANCVLSDSDLSSLSTDIIKQALRNVTLKKKAVLVLCGSAKKSIGIQPLMDAIVYYLPTPNDIRHDFMRYYSDSLCAFAFKITHDSHRGPLTFARVYNGALKSKKDVYNVNQSCNEKVELYQVNADQYRSIKEAGPGSIVCIGGLLKTKTGDTLTDSASTAKKALSKFKKQNKVNSKEEVEEETEESVLAGVDIPEPVFFCSIEAPSTSKQLEMEQALAKLQREDPSLHVNTDKETGEMILSGMGELHIDIVKNRLEKEHGIEVYLGPLQIAYREIITDTVVESTLFENTFGKINSAVRIKLQVKPDETSQTLKAATFTGELDQELGYLQKKAINEGIKNALCYGRVFRCPVLYVAVEVLEFNIVKKSNNIFIKAAANDCMRNALAKANGQLTEPIMSLQVQMDEDYFTSVNTDVVRRRGEVDDIYDQNGLRVVNARVPLAELMGYSTDLRTMTSGTGSYTMQLSHYNIMTPDVQNQVLGQYL